MTAEDNKDTGLGPLSDAMLRRFKPIAIPPMGPEVLGAIASKIVEKSNLSPLMQEGLRAIIQKDIDHLPVEQGARGLTRMIRGYLDKPLTQEWREQILSMTPAGQVVSSLTKGTSRKVTSPGTARFRRKAP